MSAPPQAATLDATALLAELSALPPGAGLVRLRAASDPEVLLIALCEETDRLAATEIAAALDVSELLVRLADELSAPRAQAETRGARAMALSYAGCFAEALSACGDAVAIAESAALPVEAARARLATVHPLARLGRYDAAIAAGEAARHVFEQAGEPELAARADVNLGAVYDIRDEPDEALRHYDRALPRLAADPLVAAQIETNRGTALMLLDDFAGAAAAFAAAVAAFEAGGLGWAAAATEGNLAYLATRQGRIEAALHHFERARRCVEADESPADLARLLAEQADALVSLGMPAEASAMYERALPGLGRSGLALEAAQAGAGLGRAQLRLGRLDQAEASLDAAAAALDRLGQQRTRARLDVARSELAALSGHRLEARILAEDALDTLAARPVDAVLARAQLAQLDLADGDLESAGAQIDAALTAAERLDLAPIRARLLHLRGRVRRGQGSPGESLIDFQAAVAQIERVRGALPAERFRSAFLGDHLEMFEDAILAALDRDEPAIAEAFALTERARSRALLDVIGGALDLVEAAGREALDPAEARMLSELARLRSELNWHYSRADDEETDLDGWFAREGWRETVHRLEHEIGAIEDRLAATRGIGGLYAPPAGLEQALALVPHGAALIAYFTAGDEVMALVLRAGHATVGRRLTDRQDLEERARRIHFQMVRAIASASRAAAPARAERLLNDVRRDLGALHALLIAPLNDSIADAERLVIVPHGSLHALPFPALWDGERYLVETREVVTGPSASVLAQLAGREIRLGRTSAVVVGVPDDAAPGIAAEAERVAAVLGAEPLLGPAASRERVSAAVRGAGIVHLACHGRFLPDRPLASGLKLGDRWLTVRDVFGLRLDASLVTLSGCETGRAAVGDGDELTGLVRAFFAAGASALVLSLWVAHDEHTTELMTHFYDAHRRGRSPAAALRDAQCALLAREPHPAFWAPFVLGGNA